MTTTLSPPALIVHQGHWLRYGRAWHGWSVRAVSTATTYDHSLIAHVERTGNADPAIVNILWHHYATKQDPPYAYQHQHDQTIIHDLAAYGGVRLAAHHRAALAQPPSHGGAFGVWLRHVRVAMGYTRAVAAARIHIAPTTLAAYETAVSPVPEALWEHMANAYAPYGPWLIAYGELAAGVPVYTVPCWPIPTSPTQLAIPFS